MLRWRLLIGLVSIFILLLAAGGYSIWLISRLQQDIDSLLLDNYQSIRTAHQLRLDLLRLNTTFLRPTVQGMHRVDPSFLDSVHSPILEQRIATLQLLARTPDQQRLVKILTSQLSAYLQAFREVLSVGADDQSRYDELRPGLVKRNLELADATEAVLRSHETIMLDSQDRARRIARDTSRFLLGAMVLASVVFAYTYYRLGRTLVTPIENLTRSLDAVRAGRFEQVITLSSNDELSRLGQAFNAMANELAHYRRDTDETILRLNRSLRETIAAFPHPIILLDASFQIWVTNEAADSFLRRLDSTEELPPALAERLEVVKRDRQNYLPEEPRDAILFRVEEREVHYLPRMLRIFSPEGDFSGVAVILIDVSRFRWLDDMKTNLISTISHEIKTPLTGIRMMLHLLQERNAGDLNPAQGEMVQAACDDCERLLATLNSLLELARMEAGHAQLALRPVSPRQLLETSRNAFATQADNLRIHLEVLADANLPTIAADAERMSHVIGNFLSNALKFAPRESTVRLTAVNVAGGFVRLSVIDQGQGVPEASHAHIFDKFYRFPGQKADGAGLGLSIAREIVLAHEGRIGVESQPHVETRFFCDIPVSKPS